MAERVFPMLVGCGRSGTTLIRNVLDAHPELALTHEAHFVGPMGAQRRKYETGEGVDIDAFLDDLYQDSNFVRQGVDREELRDSLVSDRPESYADAVRSVFAHYARNHGKKLYGDKTPGSVTQIKSLAALFPEARFIHIIRDGRAVALSYMERPEWGPSTAAEAAHHWRNRVLRGRHAGSELPGRYLEVKYEDMVSNPEEKTREMCDFLGIEYDDRMLSFHKQSEGFISSTKNPDAFRNLSQPIQGELRDWRAEIKSSDREIFEAIAGELLAELGYSVEGKPHGLSTKVRLATASIQWQNKRVSAWVSRKLRNLRSKQRATGETAE